MYTDTEYYTLDGKFIAGLQTCTRLHDCNILENGCEPNISWQKCTTHFLKSGIFVTA